MSFQDAVKVCFSKYVDFNGRARRSEFWWWVLFTALLVGYRRDCDAAELRRERADAETDDQHRERGDARVGARIHCREQAHEADEHHEEADAHDAAG